MRVCDVCVCVCGGGGDDSLTSFIYLIFMYNPPIHPV